METLGRYLLVSKLAVGGMAEIFLAKLVGAAGFEKDIVIKRILPQWCRHEDFVAMLIDEAKISVRLAHPNVVTVYELAREGDAYYIALEYVAGTDARRLMRAVGAFPPDIALYIVTEILSGLAYAHGQGIVHRDVSPQNILLSHEGAVKLTDFGIAQAAWKTHETATGVLKGKFAYMSPEQASGKKQGLDGRSDVFSAAVVLYEMLSGERLFYAGSDIETLDRVRQAKVTPSPQALQIIPAALLKILFKALAESPDDRYSGASDFREALQKYAREAGLELKRERLALVLESEKTQTSERETLVERGEARRNRPFLWAAGGALFAIVALAFVVKDWPATDAGSTRDQAGVPASRAGAEMVGGRESGNQSREAKGETRAFLSSGSDFEPPPVVALKKKEEEAEAPAQEKGYLSVRAIPWGAVTIDGGKRRWETPVKRLPLPTGRHVVRIAYEPDGDSLSSAVTIMPGKEMICVANFRSGKELRCGN